MSNAAIERMIADRVVAALAAERTTAAAEAAKVARAAAAAETTRVAATAGGAGGSNNAGPAAGAGGPNVAGPNVGAVAMNAVPEVRGCSYKEFMSCQPTNFKGTEGAVGLTRWFERSESVFLISKCAENDKVKYATSTLLDEALSWWNSVAQPIGIENAYKIPWVELKKMMIKQYCPRSEVQKLEVELWNHMVKGVDITTYNRRFQELAILCPAMVPTIEKLLERYVWGLPQPIQGNVTSFDPATIDEAMRMARRLMDQAVRAGTVLVHDNNHNRNHNNNNPNNNKRRWNDNRRGDNNNPNNQNRNINHHNQQNHRQENAKGYAAPARGRGYVGNLPLCNRCKLHHTGPCTIKCKNCQKVGHQTKDYRGKGPATGANTQPILTCFGCGEHGHFKNQCPQNNGQQQGGARGKVYVLGDKNAQQDPNMVTAKEDLRKFSDIGAWNPDRGRAFGQTQLEDLGLNTCNHDIPLSNREVPSFDEPKPQPNPLPNFPSLDVSLGEERGPKPPIKPHSSDSFRMKEVDSLTIITPPSPHVASSYPKDTYCYYRPCIDDPKKYYGFKPGLLGHSGSLGVDFSNMEMIENDWELESTEVAFLGRGLNSPIRPE
ncbi:reverse transcriptase domain-containing protein [Tanacetum coccineum]